MDIVAPVVTACVLVGLLWWVIRKSTAGEADSAERAIELVRHWVSKNMSLPMYSESYRIIESSE